MKNKTLLLEWIFLVIMVGVISSFCAFKLHRLHFKIFIVAAYFVVLVSMLAFFYLYSQTNIKINNEDVAVNSLNSESKGGDKSKIVST